ncbi:MAG: VWA domain-containing protein, partial [Gammaproteobacteria bacterium]
QYLQRQKGTQAPEVFEAWMVDRDFNNPAERSLEVRVLLTRNQLSDLQNVLRQVLLTAEEGVLSPQTFLDDLKSLAATISRDPASAGASTRTTSGGDNLADMGYMREYIDDLPYTGEVMNLTISDWEEWPAKEQLRFIHRLEAKINYYQALHDNTDLWIALDDGPITGDAVFPVILDLLP